MKKIFSYLLLLSMIFTLTACSTNIEYKDDLDNYKTKESIEDVGENKKFKEEILQNPNSADINISDTLKVNYLNENETKELLTNGTGILLFGNVTNSNETNALNTYIKAISGGSLPINYVQTNTELSEEIKALANITNINSTTVVFVKEGNIVSTVDLSTISDDSNEIYQKAKKDIYEIK